MPKSDLPIFASPIALTLGQRLEPGRDGYVGAARSETELHQQPVVIVREATEAEWLANGGEGDIIADGYAYFYEVVTD